MLEELYREARINDEDQGKEEQQLFDLGRTMAKSTGNNSFFIGFMIMNRERLKHKFEFPSSIRSARWHQKAMKFGFQSSDQNKIIKLCACCGLHANHEPLPVTETSTTIFWQSENDQDDFKVNSSVAFFFTFIKYLISLFFFRFLVVDCFNIFSSLLKGNYCQSQCKNQFWSYISLIEKFDQENLMQITEILSFLMTVLMIPFFLLYRKLQHQMLSLIDNSKQTQDDYTIFVEGIPILNFPERASGDDDEISFNYDQDLDKFFTLEIRKWLRDEKSGIWEDPVQGSIEADYIAMINQSSRKNKEPYDIVKSITLCYNIEDIERINQLRTTIMEKYEKKMKNNPEQSDDTGLDPMFSSGKKQLYYLNEFQTNLCSRFAQDKSALFNSTHFVGCAFISFKYQHFRDYVCQQYEKDKNYFMLKGHRMTVSKATFPSDIKWENFSISNERRESRILISYIFLFVFLIVGFAALFGSDLLKSLMLNKLKDENGSILPMAVTLITTVVTLSINFILQMLSHYLTQWQRHQNKANEKLSLTIKLVVTQFLNTAVIYELLSIAQHEGKEQMMSEDGFIFQISSLIVTSGMIQIIVNFINVSALMRTLARWQLLKNEKNQEQIMEFQINLNKKFELVEFDLAQRYAYYIFQLWTVSFYVYAVPICGPAIAFIMAIQYWVDKFNLFRRSSLSYQLNYSLCWNIVKLAEFSIFLFAAGVVIFSYRIYSTVHPFNLLGLIVSVIFIAFTLTLPQSLQKKLYGKQGTCETASYDECQNQGKFLENYWDLNPATKLVNESLCTKRKVDKKKFHISYRAPSDESLDLEDLKFESHFKDETKKKRLMRRKFSPYKTK